MFDDMSCCGGFVVLEGYAGWQNDLVGSSGGGKAGNSEGDEGGLGPP